MDTELTSKCNFSDCSNSRMIYMTGNQLAAKEAGATLRWRGKSGLDQRTLFIMCKKTSLNCIKRLIAEENESIVYHIRRHY